MSNIPRRKFVVGEVEPIPHQVFAATSLTIASGTYTLYATDAETVLGSGTLNQDDPSGVMVQGSFLFNTATYGSGVYLLVSKITLTNGGVSILQVWLEVGVIGD